MTSHQQNAIRRKVLCLAALIAADLTTLLAAFFSAYALREFVLPLVVASPKILMPVGEYLRHGFVLTAVTLVCMFFLEKLYSRRMAFWEEYRHLFKAVSLTVILLVSIVFITRTAASYSRPVILLFWLFALAYFPASRMAVKRLLIKLRLWTKKVLILGTGRQARLVALSLKDDPILGYELVGFLSEGGRAAKTEIIPGVKVLGPMSRVKSLARGLSVQDIILAVPSLGPDKLNRLMEQGETMAETIRIAPGFGNIFTFGVEVDNWGSMMTLAVPRNLVKPWNILIKRSLEYILALILFVLLAPVFLAISLAIKLDSAGPVVYRQKRLARKNRVFPMLKFRSMVVNNRSLLHDLLEQDRAVQKDWSRFQKIRRHDPRVTRVGRFLRKHSLDELPQLINVLRGEMSLVGPRPYLPQEKKRIGRSLPIIAQVKPGLTGLWQVNGRNRLTFRDRLAWDEYYIRNWSLWLDLSILIRTIKVMARSEGAY
jgi:Undecaprenyl-phosphate galactose phosphotransferase WbaP